MRILLDTCTFLWLATDDIRLSQQARARYRDPYNDVFLSSISLWEIGVKQALGKLNLPGPPAETLARWLEELGVEMLPFSQQEALMAASLPPHHKDPFDRMLICQALAHDLTLLTPDLEIRKYSAEVTW